ncbi:MAG: hypothetical protein Q9218_004300 [Villophora microphyllina]
MMAAGQEDSTEIIGTEGKLTVNMQPQLNLVNHYGKEGVRRELPETYYERFEDAFVREANEFTDVCLDGGEVPVRLEGAVRALSVGCALQESLRTGEKIWFDEVGKRIEKAWIDFGDAMLYSKRFLIPYEVQAVGDGHYKDLSK